ncbi:hypothetical protein [Melittangium boletus]|uniref:Uncharacterized protein n=1 Tax=Melittangium boletus DSM 14713 TaxID=1294270 RepID=A0A250IBV0_9BACT|nr:hypothetical protein [Melittangium boletus]ATB29334.1 hypothetical protein MEBOL_002783 [Melittangium boletus DSM 14713]
MTKTFRIEPSTVSGPSHSTRQEEEAHQDKQLPLKSEATRGEVRYGHAHAQTEERYQQRRAEYDMKKHMRAEEAPAQQEQESAQEPAQEAAPQTGAEVSAPERVKELARDAVRSVLGAAKEAAQGHPIAGARKLAGDAVSGALKVAKEVTNRSGGKH